MCIRDRLITPRGYYREKTTDATGIGQEIMINSFRTIEKELKDVYKRQDQGSRYVYR